MAHAAGFDPVAPLVNESPSQVGPFDTGMTICRAILRLIDRCDLIIANLAPFRVGLHGSSGARVAACFIARVLSACPRGLGQVPQFSTASWTASVADAK